MAPVAKRPAANVKAAAKGKAAGKGKAASKAKASAKSAAAKGACKGATRPAPKVAAVKVAAAKAAPPAAKRQKLDPAVRAYQVVLSGLQQATCVPEHVKDMVLAMLECALLTFQDQRHKYHESVVGMSGEILAASEAELVKVFDEAKSAEAKAEEEHQVLERVVEQAEVFVKEKQEAADACRQTLSEHAADFKEKTEGVRVAEAARKTFESSNADAFSQKEAISKAVEEQFKPLVAGAEADSIQGLLEPLMSLLQELALDGSIVVALPEALSKGPGDRGPFDKVVVQNVDEELEKRTAAFTEKLVSSGPEIETQAAAVAAAEDAFEAANQKQQQSAQALWDAQAAVQGDAEKVEKATADAKGTTKLLKAAAKEAAAAEKKLAAFRNGPLATFVSLRDRVSDPPEKPEASVEPMDVSADVAAEERQFVLGPGCANSTPSPGMAAAGEPSIKAYASAVVHALAGPKAVVADGAGGES